MSNTTELDVRTIPPHSRHTQIFGQLDALNVGDSLQIVNDHDPVPLRYQLDARAPGQFNWFYVDHGPDLWRVKITKQAAEATKASGSCCSGGACG